MSATNIDFRNRLYRTNTLSLCLILCRFRFPTFHYFSETVCITYSYPFRPHTPNTVPKCLLASSLHAFFFGSMYVVACVSLTRSPYSHSHRMLLMICRFAIPSTSFLVTRYRQSDVFFSAHFVHTVFLSHSTI